MANLIIHALHMLCQPSFQQPRDVSRYGGKVFVFARKTIYTRQKCFLISCRGTEIQRSRLQAGVEWVRDGSDLQDFPGLTLTFAMDSQCGLRATTLSFNRERGSVNTFFI